MKRILVAYDGGAPARRALDTAIELAKKFDALITVVSVVPFHPGRSPIDPWDDQSVHAKELQGIIFEELKEGDALNFEIADSPKGQAAVKISRA